MGGGCSWGVVLAPGSWVLVGVLVLGACFLLAGLSWVGLLFWVVFWGCFGAWYYTRFILVCDPHKANLKTLLRKIFYFFFGFFGFFGFGSETPSWCFLVLGWVVFLLTFVQ